MIIKHELRLHLNELIDYVWMHDIKDEKFSSNNGSYVIFENRAVVESYIINKNDLFTVTDEINITLDTQIDHFLEKDIYGNYREHFNMAINELLFLNTTLDLWLINDDDSHILIYKDGKLIDEYMYHRFEYEANQNKHVYPSNKASGTYPHNDNIPEHGGNSPTPPNDGTPEETEEPDKDQAPHMQTVKTQNGTVMQDYTPISSMKSVKKVGILGDSVAKGSHATYNFGDYIHEKTGAEVENVAESSATFTNYTDNSILNQADKIKDKDLVIIQGTDDDWLQSNPKPVYVGNGQTQNLDKCYIGAFKLIVDKVKANNPNAKIIAMTPTKQNKVDDNDKVVRTDKTPNSLGYGLKLYVDPQISTAQSLDIAVYDAFNDPLIDPYDDNFRHHSMKDGLHPTKWGHEVIYYKLVQTYYEKYDSQNEV